MLFGPVVISDVLSLFCVYEMKHWNTEIRYEPTMLACITLGEHVRNNNLNRLDHTILLIIFFFPVYFKSSLIIEAIGNYSNHAANADTTRFSLPAQVHVLFSCWAIYLQRAAVFLFTTQMCRLFSNGHKLIHVKRTSLCFKVKAIKR